MAELPPNTRRPAASQGPAGPGAPCPPAHALGGPGGPNGPGGRAWAWRAAWPWLAYAAAWGLAPAWLDSPWSVSLLSQMGVAVLACLSFNLLLGQGGMLSFGHALYTGMGAYLAMHAMLKLGGLGLGGPAGVLLLALLPLWGALAGALLAGLLGWLNTQRAGTPFAMISLGLAELFFAAAWMLPGWFGGEGGLQADRVLGPGWGGVNFGPPVQVAYLVGAYTVAGTGLLWAFTQTPLGRLLNAVRDNPERVDFTGHNPRLVRYLAFVVAGGVAGLSGGLAALVFEIASPEVLGPLRSGSVLLFTVLGGTGHFAGPVLGGVLWVLASVWWSELSPAWLLYLGLVFMGVVIWLPGGLVLGLLGAARGLQAGRWRALPPDRLARYLACALAGLLALWALGGLVEMAYQRQLDSVMGGELTYLGLALDSAAWADWLRMTALALLGFWAWAALRPRDAGLTPVGAPAAVLPRLGPAGPDGPNGLGKPSEPEPEPEPESGPLQDPHPAAPAVALPDTPTTAPSGVPLLELRGIGHRFGATRVLSGVNLVLHAGQRVALIGPNGAGKTSLFGIAAGGIRPSEGEVWFAGQRTERLPPHRLHRLGMARSFQISQLFGRLSVWDNLRCAAMWRQGQRYRLWGWLERADALNEHTEVLLQRLGLGPQRGTLAMHLAYAEQRALELGMALAGDAPLVLLDEPTAGMGCGETQRFVALIRELTVGKTLLVVEHDMGVVFDLADRVLVLVQGQVLAFDTPAAVRANPLVQAAYLGETGAGGA